MIGGFLGGSVNSALNGANFQGIMMGGLVGAALGGVGGGIAASPLSTFAKRMIGGSLLLLGGAYAAATGNVDSFAGGLAGAAGGYGVGTRIANGKWPWAQNQQVQQQKQTQSLKTDKKPGPTYKIKTNYDVEGKPKSFDFGPDESNDSMVLGKVGSYEKLADQLGAKKFYVPKDVWSSMSPGERQAANLLSLDRTINRGGSFIFSNSPSAAYPGSGFSREIQHLIDRGINVNDIPVIEPW